MQAAVTVLLVEGNELVRRGLVGELAAEAWVDVVGEAGDTPRAVVLLNQLRPDIVVVDARLPGGGGVDVCRAIDSLGLDTRVIALAGDADESSIRSFMQAGARGYVLRSAASAELVRAIDDVAQGLLYFSIEVTQRVRALLGRDAAEGAAPDPRRALTPRETQVHALMGRGLTNRQIAAALLISTKTVESHVGSVLAKLKVKNRTQAALRAPAPAGGRDNPDLPRRLDVRM